MNYCVSDIHGSLVALEALLASVSFSKEDTLYILGDAVDRGPDPMGCLLFARRTPNVHMLLGNHDHMMLRTIRYHDLENQERWFRNGGKDTLAKYMALPKREQDEILDFLDALPLYESVTTASGQFLLVHAGVKVDETTRDLPLTEIMAKQTLDDMIWIREPFFCNKAIRGVTTVFGHSPTPYLLSGTKSVWFDPQYRDKIGIDCAFVYGRRMALLCLDDLSVSYCDQDHRITHEMLA